MFFKIFSNFRNPRIPCQDNIVKRNIIERDAKN